MTRTNILAGTGTRRICISPYLSYIQLKKLEIPHTYT